MVNCRFSDDAARREATPVDNLFIAEYLPHASGLQVQVYLYGLMQCRYPSMGERPIDEALGLSEQAVRDAFAYWQSLGLVRIASDVPLTVEYRPLGEAAAQALPAKYAGLVRRIGALVAPRQFGVQELRHVYDWIEVYGLEEGAVLELIGHCMERKGRRVSVNYMTRVAQTWAERGVRTFEDAQAAVAADDLRRHGASAVLRAWNRRRRPTEDELALYDKWTRQWGFSDEAILAALPRLTATGSPNFTYLDELLDSMRGRQLTEKERIEADDEQTASDRAFARVLFERAGKAEPATRTQRAQIGLYLREFGMPPELLLFAADCSRGANEPFGRMKRLLNDWHEQGVSTVAQAEARMAAQEKARPAPRRGSGTEYAQRPVDEAALNRLILDLNEDL